MKCVTIDVPSGLLMSPSMRREWIEIFHLRCNLSPAEQSPSMRREWIEILMTFGNAMQFGVSLHAEGVD